MVQDSNTFDQLQRAINGDEYDYLVMGDRRATPRDDIVELLWAFLPEWLDVARQ